MNQKYLILTAIHLEVPLNIFLRICEKSGVIFSLNRTDLEAAKSFEI